MAVDEPVLSGTTYTPGRFGGALLLYDYAAQRVACIGVAQAVSSAQVVAAQGMQQPRVRLDLRYRALRAALDDMRAVR